MSYTGLAVFGLLLAASVDLIVLRTKLLMRKAFWASYAIMLAFQLAVNGVLTGVPVVRYNPRDILGARLVFAPIEDLAFGFTLVLITLSCWAVASRKQETPDSQRQSRPGRS